MVYNCVCVRARARVCVCVCVCARWLDFILLYNLISQYSIHGSQYNSVWYTLTVNIYVTVCTFLACRVLYGHSFVLLCALCEYWMSTEGMVGVVSSGGGGIVGGNVGYIRNFDIMEFQF
jgi:hypothetical protein